MGTESVRNGSAESGSLVEPAESEVPKTIRRGPLITVTCDCGEVNYLHYGARWTCPSCGRTWDTNQIPIEQYAELRATQLRFRRVPIIVSTLVLACVVAFIIIGKALGGLLLVAVIATTWNIFFRPVYKRRYQAALKDLPTWSLKPE